MQIKTLAIISGVLLLFAIPTGLPYGYYVLLRWIIFFTSIIVAYGFYNSKLQAWALIFGGLAFLFNPIAPIHLSKEAWVPIDFVGASLFFLAAYSVRKHNQKP